MVQSFDTYLYNGITIVTVINVTRPAVGLVRPAVSLGVGLVKPGFVQVCRDQFLNVNEMVSFW